MHCERIGRLAFFMATLGLAVPATARQQYRDVISREFTIGVADSDQAQDFIGREITVAVIPPNQGPFDSISREFTLFARTPDLTVSAIDAPLGGINGTDFQLSWTISNLGPAAFEGSFVDRLYRSSDDQLGGDVQMGAYSFSQPIAPGAEVERTQTLTWSLEPGSWWFILKTDADGDVVEEPDEDNNVAVFGPVIVADPPSPNLVITEIVPPTDGVLTGSSPTISFTVANIGETATAVPAWTDRVYLLSSGSGSATGGSLEANTSNPTYLQAGESYTTEVAISLPADSPGEYWIGVATDSLNSVEEGEEGDNTRISASFNVDLAPQPDLTPADVVGPTTAFSGNWVSVSWQVWNLGGGSTDGGQWVDALYLSDDDSPLLSPGDVLLKSVPRSGLPLLPGQSEARQATTFLQPEWFGPKHVKVFVDASQSISEFGFELNNVLASVAPIDIALSLPPDLHPVTLEATGPLMAGHQFFAHWEVANLGATQGVFDLAWKDRVYLSQDGQLAGATLLSEFGQGAPSVDGVWLGLDYERDRALRIPNDTAQGLWHLLLIVDHHDEVFEQLGEDNNALLSSPIQIDRVATNLVIEVDFDRDHGLPPAGLMGETVPLSFRVTNVGEAVTPVSSWADRIYLSDDDQPGGDTLLHTRVRNGTLEPGMSYIVEADVPLPYAGDGPRYLLFRTDTTGAVFELGSGELDNSVASAFEVIDSAPDLAALSILCDDALTSGDEVALSWEVINQGTLSTSSSVWIDRVYLSESGVLDGSEILLASRTHAGRLSAGESYITSAGVQVPVTLSGLYYVVLVTDAGHQTYDPNRSNNLRTLRALLNIDLADAANLVVRDLLAPATVQSGQRLDLAYTVRNEGAAPTSFGSWIDKVWLSLDEVLDPATDLYLGYHSHSDFLDTGEERAVSRQLDVPLGTSGAYFVLVRTDANDHVWEDQAEGDNDASSGSLTQIELPPVTDLVVQEVLTSGAVLRGAQATFDWVLRNDGADLLSGAWTDSLYLSSDEVWDAGDRLFGHFTTPSVTLAPGETLPRSGTANVPAVTPGDYNVLVRTDVFDQIPETDSGNNLGVSAQRIPVTATPLVLGVPLDGPLVAGQDAYFALDVDAGQTVRVTLDHASPVAWTELYLRYGLAPTPGQFDLAFDMPGLPDQQVTIPMTNAGTYYVLARATHGTQGAGQGQATLLAESLPFELHTVSPDRVGTGIGTLALEGALFDDALAVQLRSTASGAIVEPLGVLVTSATAAEARFDLTGLPFGSYDVSIDSGAGHGNAELAGALTIEPPAPLAVEASLALPPSVRAGGSGIGILTVRNTGNLDVPYALVDFWTERSSSVTISIPSQDLFELPAGTEFEGESFVLRDLEVGGERTLVFHVAVASSHAEPFLPIGAYAHAFDHDGFRDGPLFRRSEVLRLGILGNPDADEDLLVAAEDAGAWWATMSQAFDENGLDVPGEAGAPGPDFDHGSAACNIFCAYFTYTVCTYLLPGNLTCYTIVGVSCASYMCPLIEYCLENPLYCFGACFTVTTGIGISPVWCLPILLAIDPNEKAGPAGFGVEQTVAASAELPYRIYFENLPEATAPAARVTVTDELSELLDPASFRLRSIQFGETLIELPPAMQHQSLIDLSASHGVLVELSAGISISPQSGLAVATWTLTALDPETLTPVTSGELGFLPPNDDSGRGEGHVEFTIRPRAGVSTGDVIENGARIVFDANAPIDTNVVANAVDALAPASEVDMLEKAVLDPELLLSWSASDDAGGTGVASHRLYVAIDGGAAILVEQLEGTSAIYHGEVGHSYGFYTLAVDHAGNVEAAPIEPDATTTISTDCNGNGIPDVSELASGAASDCDGNGVIDACDLTAGTLSDANGNGVPDECECRASRYCTSAPNSTGVAALIGSTGLASLSLNEFVLQVTGAVPDQNGIFFSGTTQAALPFGDGTLCITGLLVRLTDPFTADSTGAAQLGLDFGDLPPNADIQAGSAWNFQYWHRDPQSPGGSGYNLSDGLAVTFCE